MISTGMHIQERLSLITVSMFMCNFFRSLLNNKLVIFPHEALKILNPYEL